jgi:signal peptidase I
VFVLLLLGALSAGLVCRSLLVVTVDGVSMLPTYRPGDKVLVRRAPLARIRRGDVVVVLRPDGWSLGERELFLKRAAALPGDAVPDGIPVPDAVVPPGRLVVLGDNARASFDSRASGYYADDGLVGVVIRRMTVRGVQPAGR